MRNPAARFVAAVASAALALASTAAQATTPVTPEPASTPSAQTPSADSEVLGLAVDHHDRMTVSVAVGNETASHGPFDFLVDTGAERTVIARAVADAAGLAPTGRGLILSVAGKREVDLVTIEAINLGHRAVYRLTAPTLDKADIGADGILGLDGLQGLRVLLDFAGKRMAIGDAASLGGNEGYDIVIKARRKSGQLIMTDAVIDGVRTAVIIDTGADTSIGNRALQRALAHAKGDETAQLLSVTGQRVTADMGLAHNLDIGGLTLVNTLIAFTDAPPFERLGLGRRPALLLGMEQLRLFHRVAIDFAAHRILFEVPDRTPA